MTEKQAMYPIRFTSLIVAFILTVAGSSIAVSADDDTNQAWPVEVKCIPDPALPPDDWSYPGTILMSGYAGIHGIQAGWETPHVIAFFRKESNSNYPLNGGQVSPDGQRYAIPFGQTWTEISYSTYTDIQGVRIYNMSGSSDDIMFNLNDYDELYRYYPVAWSYLLIEWQSNTSFMMGELSFQLPDHTVDRAPYDTQRVTPTYFSPDASRFYGQTMVDEFGHVTTFSTLQTAHYDHITGLAKLDDRNAGVLDLGEIYGVSWRRDSSAFIARAANQLRLYDRDGKQVDIVFSLRDVEAQLFGRRGASGRNDLQWSPDGTQFVFNVAPLYPEDIMLVDLAEQRVINTCLHPFFGPPVWSPDGKMLAYLAVARENLKIIVVDVEAWKAYDVGRQSGRSSLTGSPEMVGWRD